MPPRFSRPSTTLFCHSATPSGLPFHAELRAGSSRPRADTPEALAKAARGVVPRCRRACVSLEPPRDGRTGGAVIALTRLRAEKDRRIDLDGSLPPLVSESNAPASRPGKEHMSSMSDDELRISVRGVKRQCARRGRDPPRLATLPRLTGATPGTKAGEVPGRAIQTSPTPRSNDGPQHAPLGAAGR